MIPVSPAEVRRLLEVTDALGLHREGVVIPLAREGQGSVQRDGNRLVLTAPAEGFDAWVEALPGLISRLNLAGVKHSDDDD